MLALKSRASNLAAVGRRQGWIRRHAAGKLSKKNVLHNDTAGVDREDIASPGSFIFSPFILFLLFFHFNILHLIYWG